MFQPASHAPRLERTPRRTYDALERFRLMARIYVSSTFEDLKEHRAAVCQTLRQMHHEVISMEDYVAGDRRPADKCLADVAASEIYVGLFALRYGFIPPNDPQQKSITELEYRKASAEPKERLVFLLDETAPWPQKFIDALTGDGQNGQLIRAFRRELSDAHVFAKFRTPEDLARQVSVAINDVQQRWTNQRLEQARKEQAEASAERATRDRQRVAGQHILDVGDHFRGRVEEQRELGRLLADASTRLVSVIGRAGIGKTALATRVLKGLERDEWPPASGPLAVDGIVYLSTRTTGVTLERLFLECAELLEARQKEALLKAWASPLSLQDKVERLLKALDGGIYLILLDHLEDLLDVQGQLTDPGIRCFLEQTLAATRGARLLVTSRVPVAFDASQTRFDRRLALTQGLSVDEGVMMLRELDPNGLFGLRDLPREQLARAVERLHGVPRALEVLAGIKRDKRMRTLDSILDAFYQESLVDELIQEGYRRLDSAERHIIDALAILGRPVPWLAVEFMVAPSCPGVNVDALVGRLIDIYMVTFQPTAGLLSLDAIDQDYALNQLPQVGEHSRQSLNLRAADYYERLQSPSESWRTLSDVEPYMLEAEHRCAGLQYQGAARTLGRINATFVATRGNPQALASLYERVLANVQEPGLRARLLAGLGVLRLFLGPLEAAYGNLRDARDLARQTGDRSLELHASGQMGEVCRRLGRLDEAVALLRQVVENAGSGGPESDLFTLLFSLTLSYRGDYREALAVSESVLQQARHTRNVELEGHVHDGQSLAYLGLGDYEQAHQHATRAIACYTEAGDRDALGYVFNVHGMACIGRGEFAEAERSFEQGLRFGRDDGNPRLEGFGLFNLARLARLTENFVSAGRLADAAETVLRGIGAAEAPAAHALAEAVRARQEGDRARETESLLAVARASIATPDLHAPLDLLDEVEAFARAQQLDAVADEAALWRRSLLERRESGSGAAGARGHAG